MVYFKLCKRGDIEKELFASHFAKEVILKGGGGYFTLCKRGDIEKELFASHFAKEVILKGGGGLLHTL